MHTLPVFFGFRVSKLGLGQVEQHCTLPKRSHTWYFPLTSVVCIYSSLYQIYIVSSETKLYLTKELSFGGHFN